MIRGLLLELRRRMRGRAGEPAIAWPEVPAGVDLNPSAADFAAYDEAPLALARFRHRDVEAAAWQAQLRAKLRELLGPVLPPAADAPLVTTATVAMAAGLARRTVYLPAARGRHTVVTVVWRRDTADQPLPVMLCLQGHTSGAHISWGEARIPMDMKRIANGGDYAVQAVSQGFVAVCIEQLGFGERGERALTHVWDHPCVDACNRALLWGATVLGARAADVSATVDWLHAGAVEGPAFDARRVYAMGNSAGGETALFAAALDTRIAGAIASGCVGAWRETSGRRRTCPDTVIPGVLNWFEYSDVVALCAPRPLLVVSGRHDHIYPFALAQKCSRAAAEVYAAMDATNHLAEVEGPEGHRFYPDLAWPGFLGLLEAAE